MTKVTSDLAKDCAYLCGNNNYAHETYAELVTRRGWHAISLLPKGTAQITRDEICLYGAIYAPALLVQKLKELDVHTVVLAGDLGAIRFTIKEVVYALTRDFIGNTTLFARHIRKNSLDFRVVTILQTFADILSQSGINPVIASQVIPELKPPVGPINSIARSVVNHEQIKSLVAQAFPDINQQPRMYVRQAVVMDGLRVIASELENTASLLNKTREIPKVPGVMRTLVKLAPSQIVATIDAPVIGADTISHAAQHGVDIDLIIVDSKSGIIAQPKRTIELADENQIALYGYEATEN
jgi:DUF1009 family protein